MLLLNKLWLTLALLTLGIVLSLAQIVLLIQSLLMNQGNMRVQHMDNTSMEMVRTISEDNILDIVNTEDESLLLESQLAELTDKLDRMEEEMVILSEESSNLQQALEIKESVILDQVSHFFFMNLDL